jgi:hypothetical protein
MAIKSILFVTLKEHRYTHELFAHVMRENHNLPVFVSDYSTIQIASVRDALVVLCDHERFRADDRARLDDFEQELYQRGAGRILNSPSRVKTRLHLLQHLFNVGLNDHRAFPIDTDFRSLRFPVFLRSERDHDGPKTALLYSPDEVSASVAQVSPLKADLVVEFADCRRSPDGLYSKYGAVGWRGTIIPRHLFFSGSWSVKRPKQMSDEELALEVAYIESNPFADQVANVFEHAGIDYGRIDFATRPNGGIITFEINTNPTILDTGDLVNDRRKRVTDAFLNRMTRHFCELLQ